MTFLKPVIDKNVTPKERNLLIIEYQKTHTLEETAKEFGMTRQRVWQICNPKPPKPKKKRGRKRIRFNQEKTNMVIELYYGKQMGIKKVAEKMKVSNKVIERILRKNNITIREPLEKKES